MIQSLYENDLIADDRLPVFTFECYGRTLGFYAPAIIFWLQVLTSVAISAICASFIWAIIYFGIIPNRGSTMSYIIAFGVAWPLVIWYPLWFLEFCEVKNLVARFCFCGIYPSATFFRTTEALYGNTPKEAGQSFKDYLTYNVCVLSIEYERNAKNDKIEMVKPTTKFKLSLVKKFVLNSILFGITLSLLKPHSFEPYPTDANGNEPGYYISHLTDFNLFRNNFFAAIFFQITLTTFTILLGCLASVVFGAKTSDAFHNPVFKSTSVAEFWGKRWNMIVHGVLKRGVFKPVYKSTSMKFIAVLATFFASGLLHEYLLYAVYFQEPKYIDYGKSTAFFLWNAGSIVIEALLGQMPMFRQRKERVPKPVRTFFVVAQALPIAHWFVHPYSKNGLFEAFCCGFPMIQEIAK